MGTQAMITIIHDEPPGLSALKIIAGCDGYNIDKVIERLQEWKSFDPHFLRSRILQENLFGCGICLVVMTKTEIAANDPEEIPLLYHLTFDEPSFCPRTQSGYVEHLRILDKEFHLLGTSQSSEDAFCRGL